MNESTQSTQLSFSIRFRNAIIALWNQNLLYGRIAKGQWEMQERAKREIRQNVNDCLINTCSTCPIL